LIREIQFTLSPSQASDPVIIQQIALEQAGVKSNDCTGFQILKKSIDARGRNVKILLRCKIFINEAIEETQSKIIYQNVGSKPSIVIVGAGPAGLFCALKCIELGFKPIVIERGKDVRARRRDLATLNKEGILNTDSNYCFGEGGAGTYSDGKLYTRSGKRGDINRILNIFHQFGASQNILIDAHPHIGTNKLPQIISNMKQQIIDCGGQVLFETKLIDIIVKENKIVGITTNNGTIDTQKLVLATGHSAHDVYELLHSKNILMLAKPLAIGVRVEHPQSFVDSTQYHCTTRSEFLPPANYSLVQQVQGRGVFSFCMCPGGIIATASTQENGLVVNGWSPSKRNNPYANSGMVVAINENDYQKFAHHGSLAAMHYQQSIEQKAFEFGGGKFVAPAQRITDFVKNKISNSLPMCSYVPGVKSVQLHQVLPSVIYQSLVHGFEAFNKKMKGYIQQEAIVVATESRTSAAVSIPRNAITCEHVQLKGLYPCGEGAGYAGGIVSAAMDGEKVAFAVCQKK
jgi:uncharacterized FAD-dependent dehydrogenase